MQLAILQALNAARCERRAAVLVTDTATGDERLVENGDLSTDPLGDEITARLKPNEIDELCSLDIHFEHIDDTFRALGLE